MCLLTYLNPNTIKNGSIEGAKIKDGSISVSKIDDTIASTSSLNDLNNRVTLVENGEIGNTFFKSFATLSEYETAVANGEVVYPCISYITEENVIKFEKSESPYNAIATVTQQLIDLFGGMDVKPLTVNPDYYEIFEVNGKDYLSNTTTVDGLICIPFPSFNLGDTFEIKFKLKDKPQHFVENGNDITSTILFYSSLSYLEIDESFYNRVTIDMGDGIVKEYPVGFYAPSASPDFTCKFKGDYGITDKDINLESLSMMFEGIGMLANDPNTAVQWTLQIPSGNETYGNPSDMYDENTGTGATFCGIVNFLAQSYADYSNVHITIETY